MQAIAPGNIAVIESTAEGDNMFKTDWDNAIANVGQLSGKDFYPVFLSWLDDPDCVITVDQNITEKTAEYFAKVEKDTGRVLTREQKNFWIVQQRELGDKIYQEYPSTPVEAFMATKDGSYYAQLFFIWVSKLNRIIAGYSEVSVLNESTGISDIQRKTDLYDENLAVQVAADLGMNDTMSITVFQTHNREVRIIDEIYDSGQQISYYTDILNKKYYAANIEHLILPHDAKVTELTSGKTRYEVFEEELPGVTITVLAKTDVADGIEMCREMIKNLWIASQCEYLLKCIVNYKKEWDEKWERWRNKPNHDEYSNGADSLRYVAVGADYNMESKRQARKKVRRRTSFDV